MIKQPTKSKAWRLVRYTPLLIARQVSNSLLGTNFFVTASVDITYRCTLNCLHCYFIKQGFSRELSDKEWLAKLKKTRKKGILVMWWVGGEPLLRQNLIEKARNMFPFNFLVTNGIFPLPNWKDVAIFVSLDGTRDYHDQIRGEGTFDRTMKNIKNSPVPVNIGCVVSRTNLPCLEEFINEILKVDNIQGVNFDFYTPFVSEGSELILSDQEKIAALEVLKRFLKEYPRKSILLSKKVIGLLHPQNASNITGKNCPGKYVLSLDPLGKRKLPCILAGADCSRCGCIAPYFYTAFKSLDLETITVFFNRVVK